MIRQAIEWQKRELLESLKQRYVKREIDIPNLKDPLIKVVIGPRRAGKSFFAQHLAEQSGSFGYLNLDDERLTGINDYDELVAETMSVYGSPGLLLIDEIQNLPKWELWVNRLQRTGLQLIITGSNAHLLSSELSTHLTGRHERLVLFPFSLAEYRDAFSQESTSNETAIISLLNDYLYYGGFPETTVTSVNKRDYLVTLFQSTIYKDIVKRHRITAAESIENLGRYLLSNTGSEYSFRSLVQVVGCKSDLTVRKYLRFLEESFMLFSVPRFSFKVKEQSAHNKKIYAVDNGLITSVGFNASPNIGRLAENTVAVVLQRNHLQGNLRFYFWKNSQHEEVDFITMKNGKIFQCMQVCWNLESQKTTQREIRSLLKAGSELSCQNLFIITERKEGKEYHEWFGLKSEVTYVPLWKWLLDESKF